MCDIYFLDENKSERRINISAKILLNGNKLKIKDFIIDSVDLEIVHPRLP